MSDARVFFDLDDQRDIDRILSEGRRRTGLRCYLGFIFDQPGIHCTHKYLGELTPDQVGEVQQIVDEYFESKPQFPRVKFDQRQMFGPENDVPVLTTLDQADWWLDLREKLEKFRKDDFEYTPHVTTDEDVVDEPFAAYALVSGDEVIKSWPTSNRNESLEDFDYEFTNWIGKKKSIGESKNGWESQGISFETEVDGKNLFIKAMKNGQVVAQADMAPSSAEPGKIYPLGLKVDPKFRRMGIATEMYRIAEKHFGMPFTKGHYQSPEGKAFRAAYDKKRASFETKKDDLTEMRTKQLKIDDKDVEAVLMAGGPGFKIYSAGNQVILVRGKKIEAFDEKDPQAKVILQYVNLKYQSNPEQVKKEFQDLLAEDLTEASVVKLRLPSGLDTKVLKNPSQAQAARLFMNSKDKVIRGFVSPEWDLYLWDAYDLGHGDFMDQMGFDGPDDYAGAISIYDLAKTQEVTSKEDYKWRAEKKAAQHVGVSESVDRWGIPLTEAKAAKPSVSIPKGYQKFVKGSGNLSGVEGWKVQVQLGNSVGRGAPDVGGWGSPGYVFINPKTKEVIPVARSDEHHSGWDLMNHLSEKGIVKNVDDWGFVYIHGTHIYDTEDKEFYKRVYQTWLDLGGKDITVEMYKTGRVQTGESFIGSLSDFIAAKSFKAKKGEISQPGQRLIAALETYAKLVSQALSNPAKERAANKAASAVVAAVKPYHMGVNAVVKKSEEALGSDDFQAIQDAILGLNGLKNTIHQGLRNMDKNIWPREYIAFFGDTDAALKRFDALGAI